MFPTNIVDALAEHLIRLAAIDVVKKRSFRASDSAKQITIQASIRRPDSDGYAVGFRYPCVYTCLVNIQIFLKSTDEEHGNRLTYDTAEELWLMLHTDESLKAELDALQVPVQGNEVQRISRMKVIEQRFFDDEADGEFGYMSNTAVEFMITT